MFDLKEGGKAVLEEREYKKRRLLKFSTPEIIRG